MNPTTPTSPHGKTTAPAWARGLVTAATASSVLARLAVVKLTGREPDCWRRTIGLGLRSEATRFGLASLGLALAGNESSAASTDELARRLASFLAGEPEARWALEPRRHWVERIPWPHPDLVLAEFADDGTLHSLAPCLHPASPVGLTATQKTAVADAIVAAHAATRSLPEVARPGQLLAGALHQLRAKFGGQGNAAPCRYCRRLLAATCLSLEPMPAVSRRRCLPPDFTRRRGLGFGFLNVVARVMPGGRAVDLWWNIHHAAADGAPMQEMLGRLAQNWGVAESPLWPQGDGSWTPAWVPCQMPAGERAVHLLVDFVDFTPLLRWRARLMAELRSRFAQAAPVSALLLWCLARQPEFAGRRFATAVDVPAQGRYARAVDLVAIRPADYCGRREGLAEFARDYLELTAAARRRATRSYAAMRWLALAAPALAARALTLDPERTRATFGTVGLSMLKDASVFTAPMADAGWDDGFIAIGNLSLPSTSGGPVAAVTIKGEADRIAAYPAALRRAVAGSAEA